MRYRQPSPATDLSPFFEYNVSNPLIMRPLEDEIWSNIRLLAIESICLRLLQRRFPTRSQGALNKIASKIQSCITQAEEYFWMAVEASSRVAPLLHYYAMLNLSKALIYLDAPQRLTHSRDFYHGLSDPHRVKNPETFLLYDERIQVQQGVFPSLYYVLTGEELPPRTSYKVMDLLPYCTWISNELEEVFNTRCRLVEAAFRLAEDNNSQSLRVTAQIPREYVATHCGPLSNFRAEAPSFHSIFRRVAASDAEMLHFESAPIACITNAQRSKGILMFRSRFRELRLYRHLLLSEQSDAGEYLIPLNFQGGKPLPEPCIILGITFYLSSLVRYQPHIYDAILGGSEAWLLESFIKQCPTAFCHIMLNHIWRTEHVFHRR